ncbi:MAG: glycosyltransferase [Xenococcaceae cyanobacterium]
MQTFRPISESKSKLSILLSSSALSLQPATVILLTTVGFFTVVIFSWLLGNTYISELFAQLHILQENPPTWLETPQLNNKYYLLAPTILLFLSAQIIIKFSPQPKTWSRRIVVSILLILTIRYLSWRVLSTLNLSNPIDGIFSLTLLLMELLAMSGSILQLLMMFNIKERHQEADRYSQKVREGKYTPSVDILIPTYNEPDFILKRTIIGCQALDYPNKKIYLLDDTKRPEIKKLAQELGCNYITRPDNSHAKAGNLNHAIAKTKGELIVVFDADFIPTTNFLTRTVGFFQSRKVGLVQTPQSFYNSDPIARNLGLEDILTPEEEVFYRHTQPMKDGAGSVVCAGTSFLVRRDALQEIGCFVTESLSEDYFTGIGLSAKGYELVYLDEKLSAGLAAESISAHIDQRLRWVRGTLQAFFIKNNPLTIPGLKLWQRLGHLEGLLHWFNCIPRLFFLLVPLTYTFFLIEPIKVNFSEVIYIFLPYYIIQLSVFSWLNLRSRSAILSDLYSLIQCFPLALTVIKVMLNPFSKGFKVTPKGLSRDKFNYNWQLAFPLIILLALSTLSFAVSLLNPPPGQYLNLSLFWSGYNVMTLSAALLTLLDIPKLSFYEWFSYQSKVQIVSNNSIFRGYTHKLSEEGMEILIPQSVDLTKTITIDLILEKLTLQGYITRTYVQDRYLKLVVKFANLSLSQHRSLIKMLYCRPGQWQRKSTPGELESVWILWQLLFRPLQFFSKKPLLVNNPISQK